MNRHQVLTGAANSGDRCFAVGSINGIHFTAYAAGCNIVILASDFQRVQVIPSVQYGVSIDLQVSCISCCSTYGKIAASYADKVCVFDPSPLPNQSSSHKLDYRWRHVTTLQIECEVLALAWNLEGSRLLTTGEVLQMWQFAEAKDAQSELKDVEFYFDDVEHPAEPVTHRDWICTWQFKPANPVTLAKFSSDGLLFATIGKNDRYVKIWYENQKIQLSSSLWRSSSLGAKVINSMSYSFVYVAHPQSVTGFSWRHTSKYMNRGAVANMLVTSCWDNICRIWTETVLPEDGLLDVHQLDANVLTAGQLLSSQNHKKRFHQRLQHIRHLLHMRKRASESLPAESATVHDSHKYGVHTNYMTPSLHFHLAASINASTDIPLMGPMNSTNSASVGSNFVVHWLNNKEFYYTLEAEKIAEEMMRIRSSEEERESSPDTVGAVSTGSGTSTPATGGSNGLNTVGSDPSMDIGQVGKKKKERDSMKKNKSFVSIDGEKSGGPNEIDGTLNRDTSSSLKADPLDSRIERLVQEWNQGTDMLFSIHPVDGSFLVWLVDYLDEPGPGLFRQAQVSFSSLIPDAVPACDAITMEPHLWLYCDYGRLRTPSLLESDDSGISDPSLDQSATIDHRRVPVYTSDAMGKNSPGRSDNMLTPNVLLLTKHTNGSLNLWQVTFADQSRFATIVNVAHVSRASGHRFRTSSTACHPVLPLLLTSSHHNAPPLQPVINCVHSGSTLPARTQTGCLMSPSSVVMDAAPFCSELILWRVTPVGPLSKSGGLTELARINSPAVSAFTSVAWLPTLLPTSSFGNVSNSPSALFVASDGCCLHIYQAVLDARSIIAHSMKQRSQNVVQMSPGTSSDSELSVDIPSADVGGCFVPNVVSLQSTSRPGCVVELTAISDAMQDWQHIQLIHVFQEQLMTGSRSSSLDHSGQNNIEALVNLQNVTSFEENFYLVVVEKVPPVGCDHYGNSPDHPGSSVVHMWRIVIASRGEDGLTKTSVSESSSLTNFSSNLRISTTKVCTQTLMLPPGVHVNSVNVSAGHLSSASIYPACFAPYLLATACSDGHVYFWRCDTASLVTTTQSVGVPYCPSKYVWKEWEMMIRKKDTSTIQVPGKAVLVASAYSARVAVAYTSGLARMATDCDKQLINLHVAVYECESTGGSEWTLEDTIKLKDIEVPSHSSAYVNGTDVQIIVPNADSTALFHDAHAGRSQRIIQLDWVSTEDGGHILTVGVGSQILLYAAVAGDVALALQTPNGPAAATPAATRGVLQKSKSMAVPNNAEEAAARERRWIQIRVVDLATADGRSPSPLNMSWVRNGILVVGLDSEMHVYSQWRCPGLNDEIPEATDAVPSIVPTASPSLSLSASFLMPTNSGLPKSMSSMKLDASIASLSLLAEKDRKKGEHRSSVSLSYDSVANVQTNVPTAISKNENVDSFKAALRDCGLFEAARRASPVLPQYHPRQLIELLNFGKIRRVKAILSHLLRCIAGGSVEVSDTNMGLRSPMDNSGINSAGVGQEEPSTDYVEIMSIPPLPLYALLAADTDASYGAGLEAVASSARNPVAARGGSADYTSLFTIDAVTDDTLEDPFDESDGIAGPSRGASADVPACSTIGSGLLNFTSAQAHLLARHLTHTQLPGMSSLDQMYLLAVAETVANTRADFTDANAAVIKSSGSQLAAGGSSEAPLTEAIDDCGLRFLLAARHHIYLMNTLPLRQRAQLQQTGLGPAYYIWAFHSESEEELLNALPCMQKGSPTWAELRQYGVGWWLRNINTLQKCVEKLAKASFQASKDPLDAALFYIAMKKKNLLWGLFRSANDTKMAQFFKNNFSEDRWRKAALKNAFSLLSYQKFQRAAAFFLLGGSVKDAIEVILNKLDDFQLAMIILRLYESDLEDSIPSSFCQLLRVECLGFDTSMNMYDSDRASPDPFIRSMAFWIMKDYSSALGTLLEVDQSSSGQSSGQDSSVDSYSSGPTSVFNFYNYLRTHPLIVRQNLAISAAATDTGQKVLLSGFSYGDSTKPLVAGDKNVTYVDKITPMERRLYFKTAHAHFIAGCPALALEVLTKLPKFVVDDGSSRHSSLTPDKTVAITAAITSNSLINTGTLTGVSSTVDWSRSTSETAAASAFDWSQPSRQFGEEKLDLSFSSSDSEEEEHDGLNSIPNDESKPPGMEDGETHVGDSKEEHFITQDIGDVMAHQLKFIACIKIIVDELSTLATGFEVDGGQLRYQLYIWLEKEVEVLKLLCNYGLESGSTAREVKYSSDSANGSRVASVTSTGTTPATATLAEVMQAEHSDFESKLVRIARRRRWLESNQALLRTLLSFSVLHGSSGGGLISMRMELLLLLQELQQQSTPLPSTQQKILTTPMPLPTTLPLLSAAVAGSKTVVADPLQYLQCMTRDLLHTIVEFSQPPDVKALPSKMLLMRNLSVALSACIYQCLCDSDSFAIAGSDGTALSFNVGMEGFASTAVVYKDSHLMSGAANQQNRRRQSTSSGPEIPNSQPVKWPGVSSLRSLMSKCRDIETPKLNILLCETLVAVYVSLLSYAMALYDANMLYRLVGRPFHASVWPMLFGGGLKKQFMVSTAQTTEQRGPVATEANRHRQRLHTRLMGRGAADQRLNDDRAMFQEKFVPPQTSIANYFMTKIAAAEHPGVDYDSAESIPSQDEEEDDDLDGSKVKNEVSANEHLDSKSYSWCLMRYAIVKYIRYSLTTFLPEIGIEISELAICSPLVHAVHKTLEQWEKESQELLDKFDSAPANYIPGVFVEPSYGGAVSIVKYNSIMNPSNTPFTSTHYSARPARRLWNYLVTREYLQDVFIRYVFKKQHSFPEAHSMHSNGSSVTNCVDVEPVKIIHKDQDALTCFCINQVGSSFSKKQSTNYLRSAHQSTIVVATQKEILELDISKILQPPAFMKDDTEYDIEVIRNPSNPTDRPDDLVVAHTPYDTRLMSRGGTTSPPTHSTQGSHATKGIMIPGISNPNMLCYIADRSRRLMRRLLRRPVTGVRRMASHPCLPYYLTGSQDGCVRLWEWGHNDCISEPRKPGAFPKVTKVLFNAQGNKFGVSDAEGGVCLWQVGLGVGSLGTNKPFQSFKCHSKVTSDFVFAGSSSLIATAGHSADNRNVCLFDTLLPQRRSLVQSFYCHPDGCPMVLYAPQHQVLISGGKKGEVCIFDIRQRQLQHTFQAHDANVAVKCLALDSGSGVEECFVTGGSDGDIKVWSLAVHNLMYSFPGEHSKTSSSLFRAMGSGVIQLHLGPQGHLFSCGADGSLKVRILPHRYRET